jgi:hypothetical protein
MKPDWTLIALAAVVLYLLWRREQQKGAPVTATVVNPGNGVPPPPGTGTLSGATQTAPSPSSGLTASQVATTATKSIENAVSAYTHVPLSTVGSLAQRAPTWAKVAAPLVVYPTKLVQDVIDNPVGSIKGAASTVAHDVTHPVSTVTNAAKSVASGAKSVVSGIGHALGSIF